MAPSLTGGVLMGGWCSLTGSTPNQLSWVRGGGNDNVQGGGNEQVLQLVKRFYNAGKASGLSPASRLSLAEALAGPVGTVLAGCPRADLAQARYAACSV